MRFFRKLFTRPVSIILLMIAVLILGYLIMLWNTNPVVEYAEAVFRGEIPHSEIEGTPWSGYNDRFHKEGVAKEDL